MQVTQNMETEHNWKERTEVTLEYSEKWKNTNKINDTEDCHKVSRTTITSSGSKRKKLSQVLKISLIRSKRLTSRQSHGCAHKQLHNE